MVLFMVGPPWILTTLRSYLPRAFCADGCALVRIVVTAIVVLFIGLVLSLSLLASVVGGASTSGLAGTSSANGAAMVGPALPPAHAVAEAEVAHGCANLSWTILGALEWLASGHAIPASPSAWGRSLGGAFGLEPSSRVDVSFSAQLNDATVVLCQAAAASGSIEGGLERLIPETQVVLEVNVVATALAVDPTLSATRAQVVTFAASALGLPYQWGGNGPSSYDCSGLVVAAYRSAGISLPRTAQEQHDVAVGGVGKGTPGNLVFFGSGPRDVGHVGIEIGDQLMIDAPETGSFVRIENENWSELVSVGSVA
jgi:cell wall-associated NlpC family hydrolase